MSMPISRVAGLLLMLPLPGLLAQTLYLTPGKAPSPTAPSGAQRIDCRPFGAVAFHARNSAGAPVTLHLAVKDSAGARTEGTFKLRAQGDLEIAFPLNSPDPLDMGMRGPAAIPGYRLFSSDHRKLDLSRIASIAVRPSEKQITIDNVRLIPGITYEKIVDPLGQFALDNWRRPRTPRWAPRA